MNDNENVNNDNNRLQELGGSKYKIAEGEDNIKGWDVKDGQGNKLGDVDELIFDEQSLKVRYLVLDLDEDKDLDLKDRKVLIPIGMAELDDEDNNVILRNISVEQIRSMPDYDEDNLNTDTDYEHRNYNSLTGVTGVAGGTAVAAAGEDFYNNEHFNDENLYRNRKRNRMNNITDENRIDDTSDRDLGEENRDYDINKNTGDETTIPIIEEQLNVGKREEERGGIRISSRIVETPVEKNINLREEHVTVERHPVNRPATESDLANAHDQNIEARERAEVPVVNKEARVVEEIKLNKDVTEHEESIKDTIRKTEVDVDKLNKNDRRDNDKV